MKIVYAPRARRDLNDIALYIARDNPDRAQSFVAELRGKVQGLREWPERFPLIPRWASEGLRRCHHGHYAIVYRADSTRVSIVRIFHTAQDYEPLLDPKA